MKTRLIRLGICAILLTPPAHAGEWFLNVTPAFGRIEHDASGRIWLFVPSSNPGVAVPLVGQSTTCNVTQLQLIPPSGKERDWLAMVLAATMAGKTLNVWGDCVPSAYRVDASRLIVEY